MYGSGPAGLQQGDNIFDVIKKGDVLVHHPYHSFATSTQHFLEAAARDPDVLAIKSTLYRTSNNSPIISALIRAADKVLPPRYCPPRHRHAFPDVARHIIDTHFEPLVS